ncbi:MAG: hypothetical protein GKS01_10365 [Alphaproteobacteria bacterium]|nr:hypothetical protein [Alphaproteobacteria bacterium]
MTTDKNKISEELDGLKNENIRLEGALNEALSQRDMAMERLLQLSAELQVLKTQLGQNSED